MPLNVVKIRECIEEVSQGKRHLKDADILGLSSSTPPHRMSTVRTQSLINQLCGTFESVNYLEIGVLYGASYFAAAYNNSGNFYGVDNWSKYANHSDHIKTNVNKYQGPDRNFHFYDINCWDIDFLKSNIKNKIDVFFYDGSHDDESHSKSLTHFSDLLSDEIIFIVDDYGHDSPGYQIKKSTLESIAASDFTCQEKFEFLGKDWHNGMAIFYLTRIKA